MKRFLTYKSILTLVFVLSYNFLACQLNQISFPQNTSLYFHIDENQILYSSSTEGLNKFDGLNTTTYNGYEHGFKGNNIQSGFFHDPEKNLWFSTYTSLVFFDIKQDTFQTYILKDNKDQDINEDYSIILYKHPLLYLKTSEGISIFNIEKRIQVDYLSIDVSEYSNINIGALYLNDTLTVYGRKSGKLKIEKYHINREQISATDIKTFSTNYRITDYNDSELIFSNDNSLFKINLQDNLVDTLFRFKNGIVSIQVYSNDIIVCLFDEKIILFNLKTKKVIKSFSIPTIGNKSNIYTKDLINYYYGIDGDGIYFFNSNKIKFDHYKVNNDNIILNARSPIEDSNSKLYFASRDNGIKTLNPQLELVSKQIFNDDWSLVYNIEKTSNGHLYANNGFGLWSNKKNKFSEVSLNNLESIEEKYFFDLFINRKDELFLLNGDSIGMYKLFPNGTGYNLIPALEKKYQGEYLSTHELKNNDLVLGKSGIYLSYFKREKHGYKLVKEHNLESDLKSLWEIENSNSIYVSSSTGMFHFPNGLQDTFHRVTDERGHLNGTIYSILGHKDDLYLSSNKGLLKYNLKDSTVHQFTEMDGIQGQEYNTTGHLIDSKGRFIFGGTNGINVFYPDSIKMLDHEATVHVSNILVNDDEYEWNKSVSFVDSIQFDYTMNTLTFQFHGIDYSDPQSVELKYKLESYDEAWVHERENDGVVRYANIPPGKYTFKMKASNSDKVWSENYKSIHVVITPPFWQTLWFRLLSLAFISFLIWLAFKIYYKRQLHLKDLELREQKLAFEKQEALQNERNRIAAEMHDDLGGGLTSIKFLAHRILRKKPDVNPTDLVEKILDQSGELVNNMSEIIWAMNSGFDNLQSLIAYSRNYLKKQCDIHNLKYSENITSNIPEYELTGQKRRNIFLVIKEALHNSIKHAEATTFNFNIEVKDNSLIITIEDNGVGLKGGESLLGNGLKNMKKRIEDIGGQISIGTSTTHLKTGTTVSINLILNPSL